MKNLDIPEDRGRLFTEKRNLNSVDLDTLGTHKLVELFNQEDIKPQEAVSNAKKEITEAIESIYQRISKGGRLFYIGAGTSGRLGVLDAAECPPTFCTDPELIQGVIAGGHSSLVNSSEHLEDDPELSIKDLSLRNFSENDSLVGISAGGTTPYVISALKHSLSIKALAVSISCIPYSQITIPCNIDIRLLTGPEIITGSTRLKAATATKMTLNMISSIVMIKLGKVYENLMVDVSISNQKLLDRGLRIMKFVAGLSKEESLELLKKSKGNVKVALLMHISGIEYESATAILNNFGGDLRKALRRD